MWLLLLATAAVGTGELLEVNLVLAENNELVARLAADLEPIVLANAASVRFEPIYTFTDPAQDTESLRGLCLFRYAERVSAPDLWFAYIQLSHAQCASAHCSESVLQQLSVPAAALSECMSATAIAPLQQRAQKLSAYAPPSLFLNKRKSSMSHLETEVCGRPSACVSLSKDSGGIGVGDVLLGLSFLALAGWGTLMFYKAWTSRKEDSQMVAAFSKYYSLPQSSL